MTKLLKYEIRKTWIAKLIVLGITGVAEIAFLIGMLLVGTETGDNITGISVAVLVLTAVFGVMVIGVQSVVTLHRDMNTKQGYMLYMTPKTSPAILGAKMLENGISILLSGIFFFVLGFADVTLMLARYGELNKLWEIITEMMDTFRLEVDITPASVGAFIFMLLASWLATVSTAYFADIVSSALLNGKKYNGILTFILFIALNMLMSAILQKLPNMTTAVLTFVISGVFAILFSVVMYVVSSVVMERYLSV